MLRGLNVWEKGSAFNKSYRLVDLPAYRGSPNLIGVLPVGRVLEIVDVRLRYPFIGTPGFYAVLRYEGPPGKGKIMAKYNWGYSGSLRKPPWQLVDTSIADPFADLQDDDELYVGMEGKSYGADARK